MLTGERLVLQAHVGSDEAQRLLAERYSATSTERETVIIPLKGELSERLNNAVFGLFSRMKPQSYAQPNFYEKDGKQYVPSLGVYPTDGCSYRVDVIAHREGQLVTAYRVGCVEREDSCEIVALVTDLLSLSKKFNKVSELDLNDIINILNSAKIVPDSPPDTSTVVPSQTKLKDFE